MFIAMFLLLALLVNFVYSYSTAVSKLVSLARSSGLYRRSALEVSGARVVNEVEVVFNLTNRGPEPTTLDLTSTLLVDYSAEGLGHVVEVLNYGTSWYVREVVIGTNTYSIATGFPVELKPGATAMIRASLSSNIVPGSTVTIVFTDRWGSRVEYTFTYS